MMASFPHFCCSTVNDSKFPFSAFSELIAILAVVHAIFSLVNFVALAVDFFVAMTATTFAAFCATFSWPQGVAWIHRHHSRCHQCYFRCYFLRQNPNYYCYCCCLNWCPNRSRKWKLKIKGHFLIFFQEFWVFLAIFALIIFYWLMGLPRHISKL